MRMTILELIDGTRATKKWTNDIFGVSSEGYDSGYKFNAYCPHLSTFGDMVDLLEKMRTKRRAFVIRGAPKGDFQNIPRRYKKEPQTIKAVDRQWLMVDIDTAALVGDPVESALATLPPFFSEAACWWNVSSSHGVLSNNVVKIHLWYQTDRPFCGASLRRWVHQHNVQIDTAPLNPIQPHYIADPIFEGMDDPVSCRSGVYNEGGGPLVLPDEITTLEGERRREEDRRRENKERIKAMRAATSVSAGGERDIEAKKRRYAKKSLDHAVDAIVGAVKGDRHRTVYKEAASIAELAPWLEPGWQDMLVDAAYHALPPGRREHEAERTIRDGIEACDGVRDLSFLETDCPFTPKPRRSGDDHYQRAAIVCGTSKKRLKRALASVGATLPVASTDMYREFEDLLLLDLKRMENGGA